jgi:DNA-binding CsgD family transcriptional regulator
VFFTYAISLGCIRDKNFTIDFFDDLNPHCYNLKKLLINIPVSLYVRQFKTVQKGQGKRLSKDNVLEILNATEIVLVELKKILIDERERLDSLPENKKEIPKNESDEENQNEIVSEKWESLASQELTIAKLLLKGLSDCEIVNEKIPQIKDPSKYLNKNGVNSTIKRIFSKLKVSSRYELMAKYSKFKP